MQRVMDRSHASGARRTPRSSYSGRSPSSISRSEPRMKLRGGMSTPTRYAFGDESRPVERHLGMPATANKPRLRNAQASIGAVRGEVTGGLRGKRGTAADRIFDLSLRLGELRSRAAKGNDTLRSIAQGVEEFHEAVQPLRAALEMGVSRCNQADMEAVFGSPAASSTALAQSSVNQRDSSDRNRRSTTSAVARLEQELSSLERDVSYAERLTAQAGGLRTIARWARRTVILGSQIPVPEQTVLTSLSVRASVHTGEDDARDDIFQPKQSPARYQTMRLLRARYPGTAGAIGGTRVLVQALCITLPPPSEVHVVPHERPAAANTDESCERTNGSWYRSLAWLVGHPTASRNRTPSGGTNWERNASQSATKTPAGSSLAPPHSPASLRLPKVILRVVYYGLPSDLSTMITASTAEPRTTEAAPATPSLTTRSVIPSDSSKLDLPRDGPCSDVTELKLGVAGGDIAMTRDGDAAGQAGQPRGGGSSCAAAEVMKSEIRVVETPADSGGGEEDSCSSAGSAMPTRTLTKLQIVVKLRTSTPVAVARVSQRGGHITPGAAKSSASSSTRPQLFSPDAGGFNYSGLASRTEDCDTFTKDGDHDAASVDQEDDVIPGGWAEESVELAEAMATAMASATIAGGGVEGREREGLAIADEVQDRGKLQVGMEHLIGLNVALPTEAGAKASSKSQAWRQTPRKPGKPEGVTSSLATARAHITETLNGTTPTQDWGQSDAEPGASSASVSRPRKRPRAGDDGDDDNGDAAQGNGEPRRQGRDLGDSYYGGNATHTESENCGRFPGSLSEGDTRHAKRRKEGILQRTWRWSLPLIWRRRHGDQRQEQEEHDAEAKPGDGGDDTIRGTGLLQPKDGEERDLGSGQASVKYAPPAFHLGRKSLPSAQVSSSGFMARRKKATGAGRLQDRASIAKRGVPPPPGNLSRDPDGALSTALMRSPLLMTVVLVPPSAGEVGLEDGRMMD